MSRDAHLTLRIASEKKKALEELASVLEVTTGQLVREAVDEFLADRVHENARVYSVTPSMASPRPDRHRAQEWAWIEAHRAELEDLRGQYIVVERARLAAHDPDCARAVAEARRQGIERPFVQWLPSEAQVGAWMGL